MKFFLIGSNYPYVDSDDYILSPRIDVEILSVNKEERTVIKIKHREEITENYICYVN